MRSEYVSFSQANGIFEEFKRDHLYNSYWKVDDFNFRNFRAAEKPDVIGVRLKPDAVHLLHQILVRDKIENELDEIYMLMQNESWDTYYLSSLERQLSNKYGTPVKLDGLTFKAPLNLYGIKHGTMRDPIGPCKDQSYIEEDRINYYEFGGGEYLDQSIPLMRIPSYIIEKIDSYPEGRNLESCLRYEYEIVTCQIHSIYDVYDPCAHRDYIWRSGTFVYDNVSLKSSELLQVMNDLKEHNDKLLERNDAR